MVTPNFALVATLVFVATQGVLVSQILFPGFGQDSSEDGSSAAQAYWAIVTLVQLATVAIALRRSAKISDSHFRPTTLIPVALLLGLCFISAAWSIDPWVTTRRSVALAASVAFAATVFRVSDEKGLQLVLLASTALPVSVSLGGYLLGMDWARMENAYLGAARGLYAQKNVLGIYSWISLLISVHAFRTRSVGRVLSAVAAIASLLALVSSQSMTGAIAGVSALLVYAISAAADRMPTTLRAAAFCMLAIVLVLISLLAFGNEEQIAASLGRDLTLTGRSEIWPLVLDAIKDRPALGYGYGAFWRSQEFVVFYVSNLFGFNVAHSHNGMLDVLIDIGILGAAIVATVLCVTSWRALKALLVTRKSPQVGFWTALWLGLLLTSVSEPIYLVHNSFVTVLFWINSWVLATRWRDRKRSQKNRVAHEVFQ